MRSWIRFKAYHPWAKCIERWFKIQLVVYMLVVLLSSLIGWFRIGDVRDEFRAGADQTSCRVLDHIEWRELKCNGYYDKVIKKRDDRLHEMGCVNAIPWRVENDNEPYGFNLYWLPLCWRPTFTL